MLATRGDSSPGVDPPVPYERVVARVEAVKRGGRWYVLPPYPLSLIVAGVSIMTALLYSRVRQAVSALRAAVASGDC